MHCLKKLTQPCPATRGAPKREKLISSGECRRPRQQDVLDILKFEHDSPRKFTAFSLHLIEHVREGGLELQRLLDLVGAHVGIFAVFKEARALVLADELDEFLRLGLPIFGEAFEVFEDGIKAGGTEESHGILGIFVEVGVEDALIHESRCPR